jgi:cobalt/nickel transport system permease protein
MKHEFIDHHRSGTSLVHLADPRLKLIILISYILTVVIIPDKYLRVYAVLAVIPILMALFSGVSLWHYFQKLSKLYPMIFFITFILPFIPDEGGPIYSLGWIHLYRTGLDNFILINIKSVLVIFMSIILTTTTDFNLLLKALEKLRIPQIVIIILAFMYRYIFLLIDEAERNFLAYQSRHIKLSLVQKLKTLTKQIVVIFLRTFERGERVYLAMEARAFTGRIFTLGQLHWKLRDTAILFCYLFFLFLPLLFITRMFF